MFQIEKKIQIENIEFQWNLLTPTANTTVESSSRNTADFLKDSSACPSSPSVKMMTILADETPFADTSEDT